MDSQIYVRTDRCLEIHPCVLQDIGPLGPLLIKEEKQVIQGSHMVSVTDALLGVISQWADVL